MKQEYFELGQIVNHFGIKGMVKVNPFTDDISQFEELESILVEKNGKLLIFLNKTDILKFHAAGELAAP